MLKEKLLIINISNIGDIVSSLSVVKLLSQYYLIDFYTCSDFSLLLQDETYINLLKNDELNRAKYSYLIDLTSSQKSLSLTKQIDAKHKIGMYKSGSFHYLKKRFFYNTLYKKDKYNHIVKNYYIVLNFFKDINLNDLENYPQLTKNSNSLDKNIITLHVGARNPIRSIPLSLQFKIIDFIHNNYKNKIYILGSEQETIDLLLKKYTFLNHINTDLHLVKELISNSRMFIGPDSGLLHIASALDINSLGIYGPNVSSIAAPLNKKVEIIEKDFECRPCNQNIKCKFDIKCLTQIDFESDIKHLIIKELSNNE